MPIIEGSRSRGAAGHNTDGAIGPFVSAGVPAAGYLNGTASKGALCTDTTNGKLYVNTGTLAATVWTVAGTQT
jgi:hypothetical protein